MNSSHAAELRYKLAQLINDWGALKHVVDHLSVDNQSCIVDLVLEKLRENKDADVTEERFNMSRDKVCEISAARAMVRPLTSKETSRADAVTKCRQTIASLGGSLPAVLSIALAKLAGAQ